MSEKRKRRIGDRSDGRKLRTLPPMHYVEPYIMKDRNGATNFFKDSFEVTNAEKYIMEKRKAGYKNFGMLHVIVAAYLRVVAERPGINRFIAGQKIFARDHVEICMDIKKYMTIDSPDTCIKVYFDRTENAVEVYEKFNKVVEENKGAGDESYFDSVAKFLTHIPGVIMRFVMGVFKFMDYFGWLPKNLLNVSPFHGSMFITSMGSLGIPPIFHHLYDFGNVPVFVAYGAKYTKLVLNRDGVPENKRLLDFTVVTDERICDGFYYASSFKQFKRYLNNPWALDEHPEQVVEDVD